MGFLQKHVEKVLFALLLAGLVVSVLLALQSTASLPAPSSLALITPPAKLPAAVEGSDALLAALSGSAPALTAVTNSFTASARKMCINPDDTSYIHLDATVCPFCGTEQSIADPDTDGDGIPDKLERLWGLNPNDPTDAYKDIDGDGFPTLFEYQKGTDPLDAQLHPALVDFLRLENVEEKRMVVELRGTAQLSDDVFTLQLRWQYPGESMGEPAYIRTGTPFGRNNEFLAEKFTQKRVLKDGRYVDESFATVRSGRHVLTLRRDGEGRQGSIIESTASLKLIFGPAWTQDVRMGQAFELDKISYKVIDIRRDAVVIQADGAEALTVTAPTAEEVEALKPPVPVSPVGTIPGDLGFDPNSLQ